MIFSVSHHFHLLPGEERRRIQIQLGVILRNEKDPVRLRKTLQHLYAGQGHLRSLLQKKEKGAVALFQRILDSFGYLGPGELNEAETDLLRSIPFTLFPEDGSCVVPSEALTVLMADPFVREERYLLGYIQTLSPREKRSWLRWIESPDRPDLDLDRGIFLYHRLALFHREKKENVTPPDVGGSETPDVYLYLDELFPDDPASSPLAWFYRGILPFYSVLGEMERTGQGLGGDDQRNIFNQFKSGRMVLKSETPAFGEKERYRIIPTRERPSPVSFSPEGFTGSGPGNHTEGYLF